VIKNIWRRANGTASRSGGRRGKGDKQGKKKIIGGKRRRCPCTGIRGGEWHAGGQSSRGEVGKNRRERVEGEGRTTMEWQVGMEVELEREWKLGGQGKEAGSKGARSGLDSRGETAERRRNRRQERERHKEAWEYFGGKVNGGNS